MTALYTVHIALGDEDVYGLQEFDLDHSPATPSGPAHVSDGINVLAGLRFGWSMPSDALYPLQPNAMTAAFAITIPDFVDAPWMSEGAPVSVKVDILGVQFASFHGRVTDALAKPRDKRPGVTLSIAAVDYTVDPGEWNYVGVISTGGDDDELMESIWDVTDLGDFPAWPTLPSPVLASNVANVRGTIDEVLLTTGQGTDATIFEIPAEWGDTTPMVRAIFAPVIAPNGRPPESGPRWAFDPLWRETPAPALVIDANRLERGSLSWGRNKRTQPNRITVVGGTPIGETSPVAEVSETNPFGARGWGPDVAASLSIVSLNATRVADVLAYYLPPFPTRGWALPTVRWHLTKERDDDDLETFLAGLPSNLFPRWDLDEGDAERSAYCQRLVELVNVVDDLNPYADDTYPDIVAPLSGIQLTIQGGEITLDLTLRHLQGEPE